MQWFAPRTCPKGARVSTTIAVDPAPSVRAAHPLLEAPIAPTLLRFALPNMGAMLATALAAIAETT